ncbi:hypothetical protein ACSVBT_14660 [Afipia sp. TerB]
MASIRDEGNLLDLGLSEDVVDRHRPIDGGGLGCHCVPILRIRVKIIYPQNLRGRKPHQRDAAIRFDIGVCRTLGDNATA